MEREHKLMQHIPTILLEKYIATRVEEGPIIFYVNSASPFANGYKPCIFGATLSK